MLFRAPDQAMPLKRYVIAAALAAVIPPALGLGIYSLAPWGCDASAWLCLFPITMLYMGPVCAVGLPVLIWLNRRRSAALPDGLLPVVAFTAVATQIMASGTSLWMLSDYMRRIFFYDVLIFPQGLAAGAVIGAVFWAGLWVAAPPDTPR